VVRTCDSAAVVKALALRTVLPANWSAGLAEVAELGVFVSPPVDGHVLVVGGDLQRLDDLDADVVPRLVLLSRRFGAAWWFQCDDRRDRFGWARAVAGEVERAYGFDGEAGHRAWQGEVTAAERRFGCFVDDPRDRSDDPVKWWPDHSIVVGIAAAWGGAPQPGGAAAPGAVGCVGRL
jgi:hypothetical protein